MFKIRFMDWRKNRGKKDYFRLHRMRIFELIFSTRLTELGMELGNFKSICVFCLANPNEEVTYKEDRVLDEIQVFIPYSFMTFSEIESTEARFIEFSRLVQVYIVPAFKNYSELSESTIESYVTDALNEIVKRNYEAVFLVDKTPKKSPSRKRTAILKGIHRSDGFQLRCEVYNEKGLRIKDEILVEEVGNETVYARFLGNLKWESENLIVVKSKSSSWMAEIHLQ